LAAVIIRPLPPTKSLYPAVNFFKDAYQVFDKIPQLEKKTMFRMLESFTSGKWELSTFPFEIITNSFVHFLLFLLPLA
jgi:hypothetical protein